MLGVWRAFSKQAWLLCFFAFVPGAGIAAPTVPIDTTLNQTGSSSLQWANPGPGVTEQNIVFPNAFGGLPTVSATPQPGQIYLRCPNAFPHGRWAVKNISSTGFTAYITGGCVGSGLKFNWTASGPKLFDGYVVPSYLVIAVIYAPPGTQGGHSSNSVNYQNGSSLGVTTSASQSFAQGTAVSVEASGGVLGKAEAGISFEMSNTATNSDTIDIKKTVNSSITQSGPSADGINHDQDEIWLLLTPKVNVSISTQVAEWNLSPDTGTLQYVHVGWLNGHQPIPSGVKSLLDSAGITQSVYSEILMHDPIAAASPNSLPNRYTQITVLPYEPPYAAADAAPVYTYTLSSTKTNAQAHQTEDSVKVQASFGGSADFAGMASIKLKATESWQWVNKSSSTNTMATSQSAQLSLGGPAFGYAGPTATAVYYDNIYHTFAFELVNAKPTNRLVTSIIQQHTQQLSKTKIVSYH